MAEEQYLKKDFQPGEADVTIRIGISSCLLGEEVRWNGGHTRDYFLTDTLGKYVEWVPVCPEEEVGMGVPRERVRLLGDPDDPRMIGRESGEDWTERMKSYANNRVEELQEENLHGYILKKGSPSCGMERVMVLDDDEEDPVGESPGIFAKELMSEMTRLPVEDDGRLHDAGLRENFIERVFAYYRWSKLMEQDPSPGDLVEFHTAHKMTLLAHSDQGLRELGQLVAKAGSVEDFEKLLDEYGTKFMGMMGQVVDRGGHTNVLQHLQGFLKEHLTDDERQELSEEITKYRNGLTPLIVPVTLLRHHFRKHPVDWVMKQTYLSPYPTELQLRNHV